MWDNLHRKYLVELISPFVAEASGKGIGMLKDPENLSTLVASEAEAFSNQQQYDSPFAMGARAHGYMYDGGKPDDIAVIVAQIIFD